MKIMIATPAYGGEVTTTYCDALIWLLDHFREKHPQIRFQHRFLSLSVLPFMRNLYASLSCRTRASRICCSSTPIWDLRPR